MIAQRLRPFLVLGVVLLLLTGIGATVAYGTCGGGEGSTGLTVSPDEWVFGGAGTTKAFTVKNTGTGAGANISDLEVKILSGQFEITGTTCTNNLAGGASCSVTVKCLKNSPNSGLLQARSAAKFTEGSAELKT